MDGERKGDYWTVEKNAVRCLLCPRHCLIPAGSGGFCRVRFNKGGALVLPLFGVVSALAVDPVEKKPLYHFYPGKEIFSVGFFGCSLDCPFCQNWSISRQFESGPGRPVAPKQLVDKAVETGTPLIAFTYSEPLVHYEYLAEVLPLAVNAGLKTVLVTNGMLEPEPADKLLPFVDALNIDLKSFNEDYYRNVLKGDLSAICRFIQRAAETSHIEITTLLVPGDNDTEEEIDALARFIASVSPNIPWHISSYRPEYRYKKPPTESTVVLKATEIGKKYLHFVYTGNLWGENSTYCPSCGKVAVSRINYSVKINGWEEGHCLYCKEDLYGR